MTVPSATGAPRAVRFRDLGTLLVEHDGAAQPAGGTRLDVALALLLVNADQRVGSATMASAMWGVDAPPRSSSTLDSHIWRLRKVLEPHRARGVPSSLLIHDHGGFRLVVRTDQVDSLRFEQLAEDASDLLAGGQPERALRRAEEALELWRGRPFTPASDEPWAAPTVARLEALRGQVQERRVEALLAAGEPERALVELEQLLAEQPLDEGLWAQRMLAHHRVGRTDDALRAYRRARTVLGAELGLEPGAELRDLHARILADDPRLAAPRRGPGPVVAEHVVRLPLHRSPLVGRAAELRRLADLVVTRPLTTVVGTAGCGKTRLAVEATRTAAGMFPDGAWFVDLTSTADEAGVLDAVTSAVGAALPAPGSPQDVLRTFARSRRMLLVLDNCEHVLDAAAHLVEDLLVEGPEIAVLATSREPLDVDGEHVEILHPLALPAPGAADPTAAAAVELFLKRLPTESGLDLTGDELALAARIAIAVDGVPLALELAAARARAYTLAEIAEQVAEDPSALSRIGRSSPGRHLTVREAVHGSYRLLPAAEALLHRRLSAVPGPFTADLAQHLVAGTPAAEDVVDHLTRLVHRSLLVPVGPSRPGGASRFTQLMTVRGHATHTAGDEAQEAIELRDRWSVQLARSRPRTGAPDERRWMEAVDDDLAALRTTLQRNLVDSAAAAGVTLAARLGLYWYYRGMTIEGQRWLERATAVENVADPLDRATARLNLGAAHCLQNRGDLGLPHVEAGLAAVDAAGDADPLLVGDGLAMLAGPLFNVDARRLLDDITARLRLLVTRSGDEHLAVLAELSALHVLLLQEAPVAEVLARCAAVHTRATAVGNSYATWITALRAAIACLGAGAPTDGLGWSDRMIDIQLALGNRNGAGAFGVRANLLAAAGSSREAVRLYAATRTHHRTAGLHWPRDDVTRALLARATGLLDRRTAEQARAEGHNLTLDDLAQRPPVDARRPGPALRHLRP